MSPRDEALHGRIRAMQARGARMVDITAELEITKEEVWRLCAAYRDTAHVPAQRERYRPTAERVRLEEGESAYVDLHEAVRVVVRLMPGGEPLAERMTDRWITGGYILWDAPIETSTKERLSDSAEGGRAADGASEVHLRVQPVPNDMTTLEQQVALMMMGGATTAHITSELGITEEEMWGTIGRRRERLAEDKPNCDCHVDARLMCRLYGDEWRAVRPRVFAAFYRAVRVIVYVLHSGRVHGIGVSAVARDKGQRPIEPHEWASRQLDIRHGLLATPPGKRLDTHPPILDVLVSVEELKRECATIIAREDAAAPDIESVLREALQQNPKLTQRAAEKIARDLRAVETRGQIRAMFKSLGGVIKSGPHGPWKNRAAPTA